MCRKTGVLTGSSTFEPLAKKASYTFTAAPKYPKPIAVVADACAAPAPSNPNPLRPSPARDQAVLSRLLSATALEGPISEMGARQREKVDGVPFTGPPGPPASRWPPAAAMPATVAIISV